jgi:hypothetical protein
MRRALRWSVAALAVVLAGALLPRAARAECGLEPASWSGGSGSASFDLAAHHGYDSIVGMWHVLLVAEGNAEGPPDDTVLDNALVQWHADGTEIMNSSRDPATGSFCLGVWKQVGPRHYRLSHFTKGWDAVLGQPEGPGIIREDVVLSHDGKTYSGTFTLDQYDDSKSLVAHIVGQIKGSRITVNTTIDSLS